MINDGDLTARGSLALHHLCLGPSLSPGVSRQNAARN